MTTLRKSEVERMMAGYDDDPVASLTVALRIALDRPDDDWIALVNGAWCSCTRRIRLHALDPAALDELAAELNEQRTLNPTR